ncbi:TonB-dependent receptor [Olivibacter sp. 47]|uniref:TonB-dependent receptor domain-containing protein n=1 Tax=Olivibacter sp. 47 TaxID=3056486 RepID=UPI0025A49184|nr:TonB-dependent receptor [Olivibacter sp. 47]MDM8173653.1 TonB-dependent receptor [Olivibacter sp. 47]
MSAKELSLLLFFSFVVVLSLKGNTIKNWESLRNDMIGIDSLKIFGKIVDEDSKEPIRSVTVEVVDFVKGDIINSVSSDELGLFKLSVPAIDSLLLKISHIGYDGALYSFETSSIPKDLFTIRLTKKHHKLNEVSVTAKTALIEEKNGKLIYNADGDSNSDSFTASELLRKVPFVTVDFNGEVKLRGSSSVKVFINDKPSTIIAGSVAEALRLVPANMVKRVEVITNPGARYDAEGTAGVINIITKKDLSGVNAFVNLSGGSIGNANLSAGGSITSAKFSTSISLTSTLYKNRFQSKLERKGLSNQIGDLFQKNDITAIGRSYGINLQSSYNFSSRNTLSGGFQVNTVNNNRYEDIDFNNHPGEEMAESNFRTVDSKVRKPSYSLNLDHMVKFKGDNHSLSSSIIFSLSDDDNYYLLSQERISDDRSFNFQKRNELTAQIDYSKPLSKQINTELGAKYIGRFFKSSSQMAIFDPVNDNFVLPDNLLDNMDYDQNILAVYNSYNLTLGRGYSTSIGLRYENTSNYGKLNITNSFENDYESFLPTVSLLKSFKSSKQSLRLSYNQRLLRPGITYLNPFVNRSDVNNIRYGNPNLKPEKSHQIELSYSNFAYKNLFFNLSPFFRSIDNSIQEKRFLDQDGSTNLTFANIGKSRSVGINFYLSYQSSRFLIAPNLNIYYNKLSSEEYNNDGVVVNTSLFASASFKKGFSVELFSNYNTRNIQLQGYSEALSYSMIGVKKKIINKNSSISLSILEPFNKNVKIENEVFGYNFHQRSMIVARIRQLRLNFRYQFGKVKTSDKRDDSDVIEDKSSLGNPIQMN